MKKSRILTSPFLLLSFVFLIYFITKPPSILWIDSGTMIAASTTLGIPNPPGFPFYMLSSYLFTLLPIFNNLTSLELFTIIFSLGLLFFVYRIILLIVKEVVILGRPAQRDDSRIRFLGDSRQARLAHASTKRVRMTGQFLPYISGLFGSISLAFSYEYWSQSQNTEAFIFSYFFVTLFAYLLIKISIKKKDSTSYKPYVFKILLVIALLFGLAIGANPTVSAMIPGTLYVMYLNRKFLNFGKLFVLGIVFLITASLVYSYLPIRAKSHPFLNWGNPQTLELFVGHLRGAGLNIYEPEAGSINGFTGSPIVFAQSVSNYFVMLLFQFTPILLPFIILGMIFIFRLNRYLFFFLLSVPLTNIIYGGIYYSGNQESWFILSWIFFAIFIGLGFYALVEPTRSHLVGYKSSTLRAQTEGVRPWKVAGIFLLSFLPLLVFFNFLNRSRHYYSSDYANNLYAHLDKNAIVLGTGDFFHSLSNYVHEADKLRPDVTPVTVNMFYVNKWYRDNLRQATPLSISDKIEGIIQYKSYSEYNDALNQFIDENIQKHPIYVSHLALRASAVVATSGGQLRLDQRFKFVPNGLTLKVVRTNEDVEPNLASFNYKFKSDLNDKPFYLEKNYKAAFRNVLNDYVYGYEFLGDWFADRKKYDEALFYYNKANELSDGKNAELLAHLGEFYARKKEFNISRQYLQKAINFEPKNLSLHFNLGLSFANLGKINEAIEEFKAVIALAAPHDPIAIEADNLIKQLSAQSIEEESVNVPASWKEIKDENNKFQLKTPPNFKKNTNPNGALVIYDESPGTLGLNIEILGHKLKASENIEDFVKNSPLKMSGVLVDTQSVSVQGFIAAVQVYGTTQGESSQLFVLRRNDMIWLIKVYPGNSVKLPVFNQILATFRPYAE